MSSGAADEPALSSLAHYVSKHASSRRSGGKPAIRMRVRRKQTRQPSDAPQALDAADRLGKERDLDDSRQPRALAQPLEARGLLFR